MGRDNITEKKEGSSGGNSVMLRLISASIMVPAALASVHFGGYFFVLIIAISAGLMAFEWVRMVDRKSVSPQLFIFLAVVLAAMIASSLGQFPLAFLMMGVGAALVWVYGFAVKRDFTNGCWQAFGLVYVLSPSIALIWLRNDYEAGRVLTLILFLVVWATDSGAFAAGKIIGGPKLNPAISPKKTWAGSVGGILTGALVAALVALWVYGGRSFIPYLFAGAGLAFASVIGDMVESAMKRGFGVKDTGGIIPGHGGVLDRLDGMLFATVAMTLALVL